MSLSTPTKRLTVDDLEAMPDQKNYELIDGELVEETAMGNRADWIASRLIHFLSGHVDTNRLG